MTLHLATLACMLLIHVGTALKCRQCRHVKIESDEWLDSLMEDFLGRTPVCLNYQTQVPDNVTCNGTLDMSCEETRLHALVEVEGHIENEPFSLDKTNVTVTVTTRGCSSNASRCDTDVSSYREHALEDYLPETMQLTIHSLTGVACFCDGDNCNNHQRDDISLDMLDDSSGGGGSIHQVSLLSILVITVCKAGLLTR